MVRRAIAFATLGLAAFVAACNGGVTSPPPFFTGTAAPTPTPTPIATATPTPTPTPAPRTITEHSAGISAASFPMGIAAGPDGALWFTEDVLSNARIGRITTSGTVSEYVLAPPPGLQS